MKNSCIPVTRRSTSVIRMGMAYVNARVLNRLKKELSWTIDKRFRLIINTFFKTVIPLRI